MIPKVKIFLNIKVEYIQVIYLGKVGARSVELRAKPREHDDQTQPVGLLSITGWFWLGWLMVIILNGSLEHGAHMWCKLGIQIC